MIYFYTIHFFLITGSILGSIFYLNKLMKSKDKKLRLAQLIPLAWIVILFMSFLHFNRLIYASQGRLLFPAGGCLAYFLAGGFVHFFPGRAKKFLAGIIILMMVIFCLYILFFVLIPAFKV